MGTEIQTSSEAYALYRKLSDRDEQLKKQNRGLNLLNADKFKHTFFISVVKEVELNLLGKDEEIIVHTNLFENYGQDFSVEEFFEELEEELSRPVYKFLIQHNRRRDNKVDVSWDAEFRKNDFEFEDITITIGEQAQAYIDSLPFNFRNKIKEEISKKKNPTEQEIKDFERYAFLSNRVEDLKRQINCHNCDRHPYGHSEKTILIRISPEEYNAKLKEVEVELREICGKYPYLDLPSISYITIVKQKEPLTFEKWKETHESMVQESWDTDVDKDDFGNNFDTYLKECYNNFLEYGDSDEEESYDEEDESPEEDDDEYY